MEYICVCGNQSSISWSHFNAGTRCLKCFYSKNGKTEHTIESVTNYFKEKGCILLDTIYKNASTHLNYICSCKTKSSIALHHFQRGERCSSCSVSAKHTYEFAFECFKQQGCMLLETVYINASTKMRYKCECGRESLITLHGFQHGNRCTECGYEKSQLSGKKFKDYVFPSGKIRKIQGWENLALDTLTKQYTEDDIITERKEMPVIMYKIKNKDHRYYPDIWIKSTNLIVEVKSTHTYKQSLFVNINKALFTRKLGYDFEFWIYKQERKNIFSKIIL